MKSDRSSFSTDGHAPAAARLSSVAAVTRTEARAEPGISKERVAALFDGIVAITATLLVINVHVQSASGALSATDLLASTHHVLHWAVSFIMVAVVWTEFHVVFAHSRRWDGGLLAVTFVQMAAISLIPFAAELVGENPGSFLAAAVFAGIMGANGLLVAANVTLLHRKPHLHADAQSQQQLRRRRRAQLLAYPLGVVLSLLAARLHDPVLGVLVWALCPIVFTLHPRRRRRGADPTTLNEEAAA